MEDGLEVVRAFVLDIIVLAGELLADHVHGEVLLPAHLFDNDLELLPLRVPQDPNYFLDRAERLDQPALQVVLRETAARLRDEQTTQQVGGGHADGGTG